MPTKTLQIPLTGGRSQYGEPFVGGDQGMAGGFSYYLPGMTCDIWAALKSQTQTGAGTTRAYGVFEAVLPQDYQAGTNATLVVNCFRAGSGAGISGVVDAQAYRQDGSEEVTGDLVTTDYQMMTTEWANYSFTINGALLLPGDRLVVAIETNVALTGEGNVWADIGELKLSLTCEDEMNADDVANINVDSTGGELTLAKALEVIAARCVGNLAYDADTGEVTFYGRDGQTPVAAVTLTGGGNRTDSSVP